MSTLSTCAASAKLAQLPPSVASYLRRLIARLNRANERIHANHFGLGQYSAKLAAEREAPGIANARIELAEFRSIADQQGFDGPALIDAAAREYGLGEFRTFRAVVSTSKGGR